MTSLMIALSFLCLIMSKETFAQRRKQRPNSTANDMSESFLQTAKHLGSRAGTAHDESENKKKESLFADVPLEADFVIVGAGSAGSLLAERLSRIGSVLILECGTEFPTSVRSRMPGAGCTYDQLDPTDGQQFCGKHCREEMRPGKGFRDESGLNFHMGPGGTSVLAVGAHFRGGDRYWKNLAKSYGEHWVLSEDEILKLEHEMSVREVPAAVDQDHVLFAEALPRHLSLVEENVSALGGHRVFPRYQDESGWATNSYTQFLKKTIDRKNVHMLTKACVRRLIKGDDGSVPALEVRHKSRVRHAHARREIILAAGAVGSSALLQRSGFRTATVRDQADVRVTWRCAHCKYKSDFVKALHTFFEKQDETRPPGVLTLPGFDSGVLVDLGGAPALILASTEPAVANGLVPNGAVQNGEGGSAFEVHIVLLQPRSFEGQVSSSGTYRMSQTLTDPRDLDAAIRGIRLVRKVVNENAALGQLGLGEEVFPAVESNSDLRNVLRSLSSEAVVSFQSATASCRLGKVVDGQMRVIGLPNVRVADASVLPQPPLGRTLFPTLVVAEVASKLIANAAIPGTKENEYL